MHRTQLKTLAIMLALALASSPALAGGGHGKGKGHDADAGPAPSAPPATPPGQSGTTDAPGNSGNAPGHLCENTSGALVGPDGQAGASHVAHTNFGPMDATSGEVTASPDLGRMMYFWKGGTFDFVLNAHGLPAVQKWALTFQPEADSADKVICLGQGTVNAGGQLHLAGSVELDSNLPPGFDPAAEPDPEAKDALLALVPLEDVDCTAGAMLVVHSENYRYSSPRVRYVDTDLLSSGDGSGGDGSGDGDGGSEDGG